MKRELLRTLLKERELEEDYPSTFDMEHFKGLPSFKKRIDYATEQLQKLSSGTARMIFKIDEEKVLKLAKNRKGLGQNRVEYDMSDDPVAGDIFAKVYDGDEDEFKWIEMELARKLKKSDFKKIVGIDFKDYAQYVENVDYQKDGDAEIYHIEDSVKKELEENEFVYDVVDYIVNFDIPAGDLSRPSSYGVVKRDGQDKVVLVDYGLDKSVQKEYYM